MTNNLADWDAKIGVWYMPEPNTGCWLWMGRDHGKGYGTFHVGGKAFKAHRVSYEIHKGPIPPGLHIDHLCRTPACVNPDHLEAVTNRVNVLRGVSPSARHARVTHCPQGHEYTETNTYRPPSKTTRFCRECARKSSALFNAKRKAAAQGPRADYVIHPSPSRHRAPQTHCKHGHEFTPENTLYSRGRYGRRCRACYSERYLRTRVA